MSDILIIDDDAGLCRSLQIQLRRQGHQVQAVGSGRSGARLAADQAFDLVLLDLGLPDEDGLAVLRRLLEDHPERPVAVVSARQDMGATLTAMRDGAFDYIRKPFELVDILLALEKVGRLGRYSSHAVPTAVSPASPHEIVGNSRSMVEIIKQIGLLARTQVAVLVQGESGTGKELVARALHDAGAEGRPFVAVNCSAVVPTLFESELFGHEKGAFTGADERRIGRLEQALDGTLFLDEIGDMPLDLQAKLLRVLQERTFERVGGNTPVAFQARVVAATNRDLPSLVAEGTFREDLYFRLAVSSVQLPPLRQRREDIPALVAHLLARRAHDLHSPVVALVDSALRLLCDYAWPGNIRELENALTRAVALARSTVLGPDDFAFLRPAAAPEPPEPSGPEPLWQVEKRAIQRALAHTDGNITQTASLLGITRTTLRKKIADYQID